MKRGRARIAYERVSPTDLNTQAFAVVCECQVREREYAAALQGQFITPGFGIAGTTN